MATEQQKPRGEDKLRLDRSDETHQYVDPAAVDFDPDDGLYSGTAVTGGTEIPGPHLDRATGELTELGETGSDRPGS